MARARGQAAVETVLGALVFITILIVGIHFAEVGFMALRVQEAAVSPLWDSTAFRVHKMDNGADPAMVADYAALPGLPTAVGSDAAARYADWDGRTSTPGPATVSAVYTRLGPVVNGCYRDDRIYFDLPRGSGPGQLMPKPGGGGFGVGRPGAGQRGANFSVL